MTASKWDAAALLDSLHEGERRIVVADDLQDLARRAAELFATLATRAIGASSRFNVALSGGETPRTLFSLLAGPDYARRIDWAHVHLFWGDERHVPPDDAASNYGMTRQALLDHVSIPPANVHRIQGELPAAEAAQRYEQELRSSFGLGPGDLPRFDLVLLGMGDDGHTASLFPGVALPDESDRLVVAPWVPKFNTYRITLTPRVLNNAAVVAFLVAGAVKAGRLREVIEGPRQPDNLPSQRIAPSRGALLWLVDRAAAAELQGGPAQ
jgi:6-phosphogluconolactonase